MTVRALIEVRGLVYDYQGRRAVHGASFDVPEGSVTALVGPNGAGKTTLLRCMAGLEEPLSGSVRIAGIDVLEHPRKAHLQLGFLQDFFGVYDGLTVVQNVRHAASIMAIQAARVNEAADEAIRAVGLAALQGRLATELSRGQRQRLAIARTIVHKPKLLILDEPASGLDPEARRELSHLILGLQKGGTTLVVSSHILTELEDYSTHMLAMREGRLRPLTEIGASRASGRSFAMSLLAGNPAARDFLGGQPGVSSVQASGATLTFDFTGSEPGQRDLLRRLIEHGLEVTSFTPAAQNLEQLYFAEQTP